MDKGGAPREPVRGNLAGASFRFHTNAPDVADYAHAHLAPLTNGGAEADLAPAGRFDRPASASKERIAFSVDT